MNKILNNFKELNKKLVIYIIAIFVIVFGGIIVLIILKNTVFGKISVEQLENKMVIAAKNYYEDKKEALPLNDKDIETITISELVNNGYLKSLDKLLKDKNVTCSGNVTVTKNENYYLYSPNVNCGDVYKTQKLYEVITSTENIVTEKEGLYKIDDDYVYRGENVNNYVSFADQLWRILRVNGSDNTVKLIQTEKTKNSHTWDNRYNSSRNSYSGINNYDVSRIKDTVNNYWNENKVITEEYKPYISTQPVCIGSRKEKETNKTGKVECSKTYTNSSLTLPLTSDYIIVSLDKGCKYIDDSECTNYNYFMDFEGATWTTTIDSATTYKAYRLMPEPMLSTTNTKTSLRFVINLSSEINYSDGDGSYKNPYTIKR